MIAGSFHFIAGLVGLVDDEFYVVGDKWVFEFDTTTWGWIHLLGGLVLFISGILIGRATCSAAPSASSSPASVPW